MQIAEYVTAFALTRKAGGHGAERSGGPDPSVVRRENEDLPRRETFERVVDFGFRYSESVRNVARLWDARGCGGLTMM